MAFKDHFSKQAAAYSQFRPRYPRGLFEFLARIAPARERAWDCATGGGQAAVDLAEFFDEVVATDASANQIAHAEQRANVRYVVASAEDCPLADESVDLVCVAQAIHWFDRERFYAQVRRVTRRGSVLAAWTYGLAEITPAVDRVVWHLYEDLLGTYWPPERRLVEERYTTIDFPFVDIATPELAMAAQWNFDHLLGYLGTWSSTQAYMHRHGTNPIEQVYDDLAAAWGAAEELRPVRWPLVMKMGRVE